MKREVRRAGLKLYPMVTAETSADWQEVLENGSPESRLTLVKQRAAAYGVDESLLERRRLIFEGLSDEIPTPIAPPPGDQIVREIEGIESLLRKVGAGEALALALLAIERGLDLLDTGKHLAALRHAKKFKPGRKEDTVGPIRLAIRKVLKKRPDATTPEIWKSIKAHPPKVMSFYISPQLGEYVEIESGGKRSSTNFKGGFENACTAERKLLNS